MAQIKIEVPDGDKCKGCNEWLSEPSLHTGWKCRHRNKLITKRSMKTSRKTEACKEAHVEETK